MVVAKATQEDIAVAFELCSVMDSIGRGWYPYLGTEPPEDLPDFFDEDNLESLKELHRIVRTLSDRAGGGLWRVVMGLDMVLRSGMLDPDKDHYATHPDITAGAELLKAKREPEEPAT
jgi:hypothetical protein